MLTIDCYGCDAVHEDKISDFELISDSGDSWGFMWGSDGIAPDEASAMYACPKCKNTMDF